MAKKKMNEFVHCGSKLEAVAKSSLKGFSVDVLYCIIDTEIWVQQRLKLIQVSLEQFASGMNITLVQAQAIVSGVETLEEAKNLIKESREHFQEEVVDDITEKGKELAEEVLGDTEEKLNSLGEELKEDAKGKLVDILENVLDEFTPKAFFALRDKVLALEKKLETKDETELVEVKESSKKSILELPVDVEEVKDDIVEKVIEVGLDVIKE